MSLQTPFTLKFDPPTSLPMVSIIQHDPKKRVRRVHEIKLQQREYTVFEKNGVMIVITVF